MLWGGRMLVWGLLYVYMRGEDRMEAGRTKWSGLDMRTVEYDYIGRKDIDALGHQSLCGNKNQLSDRMRKIDRGVGTYVC